MLLGLVVLIVPISLCFSRGIVVVTLSITDRQLLDRCLDRAPMAWEDFVDRFISLILQVVQHTAQSKGFVLDSSRRDDLVADVFLALIQDDFAILKRFRRESSLATYLAVISRRVVARKLAKQLPENRLDEASHEDPNGAIDADRLESLDEIEHLLGQLPPKEAELLRLSQLEGLSYGEIHQRTGVPENSIGPMLSRAKQTLRSLANASESLR